MSRSCNTENPNPAKRFYEWKGSKGEFRYYDKTTEKNVDVPLPFRFMVLDCLSTIKGFNDSEQAGYWSNEIRDIRKDTLTVKTKGGECFSGLYNDMNLTGARYCQSVYIAFKEPDGTMSICNVQMIGSALGAWIDFRKKNKVFEGAVAVESFIEGKKGATVYQIPVFKKLEATQESEQVAKGLDEELQKYFKTYFQRTGQEIADVHIENKIPTNDFAEQVDAALGAMEPLSKEEEKDELPF